MKKKLFIFLATIWLLCPASILVIKHYTDPPSVVRKKLGPDSVIVKALGKPLPHKNDDEMLAFLWDNFANKPEETAFNFSGTVNWQETFEAFAKVLIRKAMEQQLDFASLRKALDHVIEDKMDLAWLPVGAYQTTLDGMPVWILVVKRGPVESYDASCIGHISIFVYDQKTLKLLAVNACA